MKKILVLGAGKYYIKVITDLIKNNFYVIAVDKNPKAEGRNFAHEFFPIDIKDFESIISLSKNKKIDGIMPINDFGVRTAAKVSTELGLIGISEDCANVCSDKGLMRDIWKKNNLPIPKYYVISSFNELEKAIKKIGYPAVLKPTDCGGSGRGISVIKTQNDLEWSYNFAKPYVTNNRFIIEEFISGTEMTFETISIDKKVHVLAYSDKEKPNLKTRVATSLNYPANFEKNVILKIKNIVSKAVLSLGITEGMGHTELIINHNEIKLIETGARGGGGHIFHTIIEAVSGYNGPFIFASVLTKQNVNIKNISSNGAVYKFFTPKKGILKRVAGVEEARLIKGVLEIGITKKIGEKIGDLENSLDRSGYVVTKGKDRKEALMIANKVFKIVNFIVD